MSTTQTPPTPPNDASTERTPRPADAPLLKGRARYEGLEHHELLSLIDELDDERSRARMREGLWIALIIHLVVFWLLAYGPRVLFHQAQVKDPIEAIKERKDLAYLDMPPDALRQKPKHADIIANQDHTAQTRRPTLDKKTLEQLREMQRAGHPEPPPAAAPQQQPPAASAPAAPAPPQPQQPQQPLPSAPQPTQQALLDAPKPPAQTRPSLQSGRNGLGEAIRQAARQTASGQGQYGDYGDNANPDHQGVASGLEVLSDTMGVDFGPYLERLHHDIQMNWEPLIPESARPPLLKQGVTGIRFIILPNGKIGDIKLESPSGDVSLDRAAWGGILGASPFPPLPAAFHGPDLELRCGFFYNERPK
ncbi:MAG: TonB family protein [Acidobacteriaceae bacterium]